MKTLREETSWSDGRKEVKTYDLVNWKNIRYYQKDSKAYVDVKKNVYVITQSRSYVLGQEYSLRGRDQNYTVKYMIEEA